MTDQPAILGRCAADAASRLTALLALMRLGRRLGVPARLVWGAGGPAAHEVLADDFAARWVAPEDPADAPSLPAGAGEPQIAAALGRGGPVILDVAEALYPHDPEDVAADAAALLAEGFAPALLAEVEAAAARITAWGGAGLDAVPALCLRDDPAGDHLPDEVARAWAARQPGAVLVFAADAEAGDHAAGDDPAMIPVQALAGPLCDMAQILLMARCARIGGAETGRLARVAAALGQRRFCPLPRILPEPERRAARAALLKRVLAGPHGFRGPADFGAAADYLVARPLAQPEARRLADALTGALAASGEGARLQVPLAAAALAAGAAAQARAAADTALAARGLDGAASRRCRQVLDILDARADPGDPAGQDRFLSVLFGRNSAPEPILARLAQTYLCQQGTVADWLMMPPALGRALAASGQGRLPLWSCRVDWQELLPDEAARDHLARHPSLPRKLAALGPHALAAEVPLQEGRVPAPPAAAAMQSAWLTGLAASVLSAHGRYARALRLLHWLDGWRPGDPLTEKRLADTCFRLGNRERGHEILAQLLARCPDQPLLHLSRAHREAESGRPAAARAALDRAAALCPAAGFVEWQAELVAARQDADRPA